MNLPWKIGFGDGKWSAEHESSHAFGHAPILDSKGKTVALCVTSNADDFDAEVRDFIIGTVNTHSDMAAALSQAITMLEGDAKHGARSDDPFVRDDAAYTMRQVKRFREVLEGSE